MERPSKEEIERRRKSQNDSVLFVLSSSDEPLTPSTICGLSQCRWMWQAKDVYPVLARLERRGLVKKTRAREYGFSLRKWHWVITEDGRKLCPAAGYKSKRNKQAV